MPRMGRGTDFESVSFLRRAVTGIELIPGLMFPLVIRLWLLLSPDLPISTAGMHEKRTAADTPHAAFGIVAIASSAGGLHALGEVLACLPADFLASVVVLYYSDP